jgi:hypothetical protein
MSVASRVGICLVKDLTGRAYLRVSAAVDLGVAMDIDCGFRFDFSHPSIAAVLVI